MRKLKLYNLTGGTRKWIGKELNPNRIDHIYVAGYSQVDCVQRINSTVNKNESKT